MLLTLEDNLNSGGLDNTSTVVREAIHPTLEKWEVERHGSKSRS